MGGARVLIATAAAIASIAAGSGCGGNDDTTTTPTPPTGPLARALATIGGHGANGSLGVGWAQPTLVRRIGGDPDLIAEALAPNAASVVDARRALDRRFGLDPLAADRLVSVGGSYAFGLRLDGVHAPRLQRALVRAGGARPSGDAGLVNAAGYASVPDPLLALSITGLGARDAFTDTSIILAISDTARAALLGRGERLIDEPHYAAAADCLGDVAAARMIPAKLLLSVELGFDQVAMGVGRDREVLCVLGDSQDAADGFAAEMRRSLAPAARDPRSDDRIGAQIASVQVDSYSDGGIAVARATLTPRSSAPVGFLFAAVARGSLGALITGR